MPMGALIHEHGYLFNTNPRVLAELFHGDEISFLFLVLFSDEGKQLSGGALLAAGDISDVLCIDDYALWDGLLHKPAFWERLLCWLFFSF